MYARAGSITFGFSARFRQSTCLISVCSFSGSLPSMIITTFTLLTYAKCISKFQIFVFWTTNFDGIHTIVQSGFEICQIGKSMLISVVIDLQEARTIVDGWICARDR
jgi:hypothetical protein